MWLCGGSKVVVWLLWEHASLTGLVLLIIIPLIARAAVIREVVGKTLCGYVVICWGFCLNFVVI